MTKELFKPDELNAQDDTDDQPDNVDHLAELVGEGKKFKDVNSLAKGKKASDEHIATLERELAGMRGELDTRLSLEEFMAKIEATRDSNSNSDPQDRNERPNPNTAALTVEEIEKLLDKKLTEKTQATLKERNVEISKAELRKAWGPQAHKKLEARAKELGLGQDFLADLAERSPKAFLLTVGAQGEHQPDSVTDFVPPNSSVRSVPERGNPNVKNQAYYDKIKKADPRLYKQLTAERHRNAQALGEAYFTK